MIDWLMEVTEAAALLVALVIFWGMLLGGLALGVGLLLHATGTFTCGTIYCI